jgi:DNA-binding response OmpR family regulator
MFQTAFAARMVTMERLSPPTETLQSTEVLKVLIADDDPPTRVLLRAAISQWGYQVVEAKDGEEAWDILQTSDAPRLLIIDWLMPKLDGVDLCRRIKQEFAQRPYIILLTQVVGTANIVKGLEAGADEFLSKPFNMAELRSRLSVGTRIVQYEFQLAAQNRKVNDYAEGMEALAQERAKKLVYHTEMLVMLGQLVVEISEKIKATLNGTGHKEKLTGLQTNLTHAVEVIKNLQADHSEYPQKVTPSELNTVLERVLTLCQGLFKNVQITKELAANLPQVIVDAELIEQAFVGLLLNIADALKSESNATLKIITALEGSNIRITFEDSGAALSETELQELFTAQKNLGQDNHNLDQKRLNVTMCKDILAKYNGTLHVENIPTSGVRIVVYLPAQNKALEDKGNE